MIERVDSYNYQGKAEIKRGSSRREVFKGLLGLTLTSVLSLATASCISTAPTESDLLKKSRELYGYRELDGYKAAGTVILHNSSAGVFRWENTYVAHAGLVEIDCKLFVVTAEHVKQGFRSNDLMKAEISIKKEYLKRYILPNPKFHFVVCRKVCTTVVMKHQIV